MGKHHTAGKKAKVATVGELKDRSVVDIQSSDGKSSLDRSAERLADLVAARAGAPPVGGRRHRPRPQAIAGRVSDLVAEQRH